MRTSIWGKRVWSGRLEEDLRVRGALPEPREHAAEDARAVRRPLRQGRGREVQDLIAKKLIVYSFSFLIGVDTAENEPFKVC